MRLAQSAFALSIAMMVCSASAFAFSALGLRNALQNCLNKNVSSPARIEACNEAIHTNVLQSHDRARVITSRGNAYFASSDLDNALEDYNKAVELNPGLPAPVVNRAITLMRLGKCEQAISDFTAALTIDPGSSVALYGRSVCEAKSGDQAKAQSDLVAANAINPSAAQEFAPIEISRWYQ